MAVGKAAPAPNIVAASLQVAAALEATVEKFTETFASLPLTTIKRRLKGAALVMPNGFDESEIECSDKKPDLIKEFL